jgi:hypothetical protein
MHFPQDSTRASLAQRVGPTFFERRMTGTGRFSAKILSFSSYLAHDKIDFGHFAPMFALEAAPDRNAIPRGKPLVSVS